MSQVRAVQADFEDTGRSLSIKESYQMVEEIGEKDRSANSKECSSRLQAFISGLDREMETAKTVDVLQAHIDSAFPLYGCDIDEASQIARRSKYFDQISDYPKGLVIVLRHKVPNGWGYKVSFGLDRSTGNSITPSAIVEKTK